MSTAESRRAQILKMLKGKSEYLTAVEMAQDLGVSRQIIVSDIAILRERGNNIVSTPRGYLLTVEQPKGYVGAIPCKHGVDGIRPEFYIIVDNGGIVLDVSIEHPIYGSISADLNIRSRYDAEAFIRRVADNDCKPLSDLTEGFHVHRVSTQSREDFDRIYEQLQQADIVCES